LRDHILIIGQKESFVEKVPTGKRSSLDTTICQACCRDGAICNVDNLCGAPRELSKTFVFPDITATFLFKGYIQIHLISFKEKQLFN
jgi:hypothetical protein